MSSMVHQRLQNIRQPCPLPGSPCSAVPLCRSPGRSPGRPICNPPEPAIWSRASRAPSARRWRAGKTLAGQPRAGRLPIMPDLCSSIPAFHAAKNPCASGPKSTLGRRRRLRQAESGCAISAAPIRPADQTRPRAPAPPPCAVRWRAPSIRKPLPRHARRGCGGSMSDPAEL